MRTRMIVAVSLALALGACDSGLGFVPLDPDTFVIQAFLFTGEPVAAVSVTGVLPIDAESTEVPEPISDARITLIKDGVRYDLVPTPGEAGKYDYPGDDLAVAVGDFFQLEARHGNRTATAETVVPSPPTGLTLSVDSLIVPESGGDSAAEEGAGAAWRPELRQDGRIRRVSCTSSSSTMWRPTPRSSRPLRSSVASRRGSSNDRRQPTARSSDCSCLHTSGITVSSSTGSTTSTQIFTRASTRTHGTSTSRRPISTARSECSPPSVPTAPSSRCAEQNTRVVLSNDPVIDGVLPTDILCSS